MMQYSSPVTHFLLNDREVKTTEPPGTMVLTYLRRSEKLMGTKEGCREGDCGACTVLLSEGERATLRYKPVTSCLMPVGELHGKHLVTIEGLNTERLSPVQQAIVDEGASQCGFCTPGIVVSLVASLMQEGEPITPEGIKRALSGHLCRCTGYRSLKQAAPLLQEQIGAHTGIAALVRNGWLPSYFLEIPHRLGRVASRALPLNGTPTTDFFLAGGTDLYVQQGEHLPGARVQILEAYPDLKGISKKEGYLCVGALTTFEEFAQHEDVLKIIPAIQSYMHLIASWQIRNRATLGGNVINASPIGDMTILLLALEALLVLQEGEGQRTVPIKDFYKGYKKMDMEAGAILVQILIPLPAVDAKIDWEKVSKRTCLDIATVNSAINVERKDGVIQTVSLAVGGVAPVPLFLRQTCAHLLGQPITPETIRGAVEVAQQEISPISDVRGSAIYKRLLVGQLMRAHFTKLFPEDLTVRALYETS